MNTDDTQSFDVNFAANKPADMKNTTDESSISQDESNDMISEKPESLKVVENEVQTCNDCDDKGYDEKLFNNHSRRVHEEKTRLCVQWDNGFKRISRLKKHVKIVHKSRTHECSDCVFSSEQRNTVKIHSESKPEENMEVSLHRVWDPGGFTLRALYLQLRYSLPDDLFPDSSLPDDLSVSHFKPGTWPDHGL